MMNNREYFHDSLHDNIVVDATVEEMENLESHFASIIRQRVADNAEEKIEISKDSEFIENPMDRINVEEEIPAEEVKSLKEIFEWSKENGFPDTEYVRVPVVEECAPQDICYDIIVKALKDEPASTHCLFSCQAGRGRTTLGRFFS